MSDLKRRVQDFNLMELLGQPRIMHMGTSYLVNDLWKRIAKLEAQTEWLDNNTSFFDVNHDAIDGYTSVNVPSLAAVSKRIWYHATDDIEACPFSVVVKKALAHSG